MRTFSFLANNQQTLLEEEEELPGSQVCCYCRAGKKSFSVVYFKITVFKTFVTV